MSPIAPCPHRPPCPGCPRYGEPGIPAGARERLLALAREAGLLPSSGGTHGDDAESVPVHVGPPFGYRHRVRLVVRGRTKSPKVGIFQSGSHRIADIPRCAVHHPLVNDVARALRGAMRECGIRPYAERPHVGELRAVQIVVERSSQTAQVVLVGNSDAPAALDGLADCVRSALAGRLHSLWWNGNPRRTNTILGPHWHHICGPEAVREMVAGVDVLYPPGAFGQANPDLADRIVARIGALVPDGSRVVELYAGCGPIGLPLLGRAAAVDFVESAAGGVRGLELGLAERPERERNRARVVPAGAGSAAELIAAADVVIADPPRRGLDAPLLDALIARPPERFVYLSCDLASFESQTRTLLGSGRFELSSLEAFALVPNTDHVESLGVLHRR